MVEVVVKTGTLPTVFLILLNGGLSVKMVVTIF